MHWRRLKDQLICKTCKTSFRPYHKKQIFCSQPCMGKDPDKRKKQSILMKSRKVKPPSWEGKKHKIETKRKIGKANSGKGNHFWNGGVTSLGIRLRRTGKYRDWRISVFERDNYICQKCGVIGGKLEADHIKQFSLYPKLRFDIMNGQTLCKPCHLIKSSQQRKEFPIEL